MYTPRAHLRKVSLRSNHSYYYWGVVIIDKYLTKGRQYIFPDPAML